MSVVIDLRAGCGYECDEFVSKWRRWAERSFAQYPPALIDTHSDYWQEIGTKSRNMVRKAQRRGYVFQSFSYNRHLDDMYEVNTSLPTRGGRPMSASYLQRPEPMKGIDPCLALHHHTIFYGAFALDDKLRAYCQLVQCGELGIISRILGHGDCLPDGVMNGLVFNMVTFCRLIGIPWINYLTMESATDGIERFKRSMAFKPVAATFTTSST